MDERVANQLSVALELQADCLAGVWASSLRRRPDVVLRPEDIDEALRATRALGDDTIQRLESGTVILDSFTHGSGDQRARWFKRGLDTGELEQCNTFGASDL
jgi:predicted metalloprotease